MPHASQADDLTAPYGTEDCRRFRQHIFTNLSPVAMDLALRYVQTCERFNYEKANEELLSIHERLRIDDLNLSASTEELRGAAKRCAEKCRAARQRANTIENALPACLKIVSHYRIKQPTVKNNQTESALNRMCCSKWWFSQFRKLRLQTLESIARNIELVSRSRSIYASDYSIKLKRQQKAKTRLYLESSFIFNENGESYCLQDLANRSVSNPAIRRAELMVRIKGFEIVAGLSGHLGEFYTLTTPSRMHAALHNGETNPRFDGTTTIQAHEYLTHLWALIRAELHRQNIQPYGFRVVEPHHDGTPHWHLLLFMPPEHKDTVRKVMRHYALADNGNEPGAKTHRFKAIAIDPAKGTAAGYIAKYIAKNIDGYALEHDLYGKNATDSSERINIWATTWGIRQFQQIGGPSVTVWRQLRKLSKADEQELESIRQAATASDWAAYMLSMGGPETLRRDHAVKPYYDFSKQLNNKTGEIVIVRNGRYGDEAIKRIVGVNWRGKDIDTRKHFWSLSNQGGEAWWDGGAVPTAHRTAVPQLPILEDHQQSEFESAAPCPFNQTTTPFLDLYQ